MVASSSRIADLRLRGRRGPLPARVYWPTAAGPARTRPLLVFFTADGDPPELCQLLCSDGDVVVLTATYRDATEVAYALQDAIAVTEWAFDHAPRLEADPDRVFVGGFGFGGTLAAIVARHARYQGWPPLAGQLLLGPHSEDAIAMLQRELNTPSRAAG